MEVEWCAKMADDEMKRSPETECLLGTDLKGGMEQSGLRVAWSHRAQLRSFYAYICDKRG